MSAFASADDVDGVGTGSSFVHISFLFAEAEAHAFHHFVPRAGMVGHGVEEHSIHIEEHSLEIDSLMAVLLQVVIDCFLIHISLYLFGKGTEFWEIRSVNYKVFVIQTTEGRKNLGIMK